MGKFILKRLLLMIPTLWIIVTIVFLLMRVVPGSPAVDMLKDMGADVTVENVEALEEELGLNDPLLVQYVRYIKDVLTGNWGTSYFDGNPVVQNILNVMEPTLMYGWTYFVIHMLTSIPVGVICAVKRNSLLDYSLTFSSLILMVIPGFCHAYHRTTCLPFLERCRYQLGPRNLDPREYDPVPYCWKCMERL